MTHPKRINAMAGMVIMPLLKGSLGNDLETQQTTTSEKLADRSNEHKDEGIAQAVAQAIEE